MQAALTDLRCLLICISLLERVNSVRCPRVIRVVSMLTLEQTLQSNSVLEGLIHDLINPAVRNKDEPALRDQGLICLGLCALIDAVSPAGTSTAESADSRRKSPRSRLDCSISSSRSPTTS